MIIPSNIEKLGIKNLFDLYLKFPPTKYTNGSLSSTLRLNSINVVKVRIIKYNQTSKNAIINARLISVNKDEIINLFVFNAKQYHKAIFAPEKELIISGEASIFKGVFTIKQPKIISSSNKIIVHFNKKVIGKQITILREFINTITIDHLKATYPNIKEEILLNLHRIYNPDDELINHIKLYKEFDKKTVLSLAFVEIYNHMLSLRKKIVTFPSIERLENIDLLEKWIKNLPFKLTIGQKKAIEDIKNSLNSDTASKRIIVGDVGCGKTILIFSAAILCYPKQCILMVPTSILAQQIYNEAIKIMPNTINICLSIKDTDITDFTQYHFVIGTHKLLYNNLHDSMSGTPLIMIDEQHRFGTKQRNILEKTLEKDGKKPHFLQFSATPIPRTMAMIESDLLSFTFIDDLPFKKDITSRVITNSNLQELLKHLKNEINNGNQAIIIYPLVEKKSEHNIYKPIKEAEEFWKKYFKNVHLVHGKDKNKEAIIEDFKNNGDILLSTTVVEVGISLPRLSTIVISGAENFGFATLHQLRGRVSRNGLKGYCFLYTKRDNTDKLVKFCEIQNGFEVAKLDLQRRKSGDILSGTKQSGAEFTWYNFEEEIAKEARQAIDKL